MTLIVSFSCFFFHFSFENCFLLFSFFFFRTAFYFLLFRINIFLFFYLCLIPCVYSNQQSTAFATICW